MLQLVRTFGVLYLALNHHWAGNKNTNTGRYVLNSEVGMFLGLGVAGPKATKIL